MVAKVIKFITTDIWRIRLKELSRGKYFLIKQIRIILVALRGFGEDKCQLRASALTFYSLLAFVPMLAMAFGIAKGFGFEEFLQKEIMKLPLEAEVMERVIEFANSLLGSAKGGLIAGIGVALLFWMVIKVLGNIERSFNDIWGVKKARSIGRKFSDYLSIMLICPLLLIMSSSLTVFVVSQVKLIIQRIELLGFFSPLVFTGLRLLPYCVIWVLFSFIYIFMPNTKVKFSAGILAGVVAGTIYQVVQWAYFYFQIGVVRYNAIYGSFAALPLFLIWLQISWLVVLLGAEISFAYQNVETYEFEPDSLLVSHSFKRLLSLWVAHLLVKNFCAGENPRTATQISHALEIPIRLVREILYELMESGIISETGGEGVAENAYQPARCEDTLTIQYVINNLERRGSDNIPIARSEALDKLASSLESFDTLMKMSPSNTPLKDI